MTADKRGEDPFFPFSTCELPHDNDIVKQPVSALLNALTCIILVYMIVVARTWTVKFLIFTFLLFELFHTFSHVQHIEGYIQAHIIHVLWYTLSLTLLYTISVLSRKTPSIPILIIIFAIIAIDIYLWTYYTDTLQMVIRGFMLIIFIVLSHYHLFPKKIRHLIPYLVIGTIIETVIIYNEKLNCKTMIEYANLPYHAISEILGLILFSYIAYIFIIWENCIT